MKEEIQGLSIGYGSLSALNKRHHLIMTYLLAPTPIHYIELLPNTKSLYPKGASQINPGRHMKQLPKQWPINGSPVSSAPSPPRGKTPIIISLPYSPHPPMHPACLC